MNEISCLAKDNLIVNSESTITISKNIKIKGVLSGIEIPAECTYDLSSVPDCYHEILIKILLKI